MSKQIVLVPAQEEFETYQTMAKKAYESKFFDKLGGEGGLLSIMLYARELGIPPLQCLFGGMSNIQGKVELSPRLMNTMIRRAGHKLEILESTNEACKIRGVRHDTKEEYIAVFNIEEARRAGLVRSGGGWEKYASDMLFARCISRLARRLFPDVISTAYTEGEVVEDPQENSQGKASEETIAEQRVDRCVEYITQEEVEQIESNILADDAEYRQKLLGYFSNKCGALSDFSQLPKKEFKALMNSIVNRKKKREEQESNAELVEAL